MVIKRWLLKGGGESKANIVNKPNERKLKDLQHEEPMMSNYSIFLLARAHTYRAAYGSDGKMAQFFKPFLFKVREGTLASLNAPCSRRGD